MNEIQKQYGPFARKPAFSYCGRSYEIVCDAASRLDLVKTSTDAEWLQRVIKYPSSQKSVKQAAERRLRWVENACEALLEDYRRREGEGIETP